jgi:hypothetical protein
VSDALIADGAFGASKARLLSGYEAIVVQPVRAIASKILRRLEEQGFRRGNCLALAPEALYRASLETLHPLIMNSFMRTMPTPLPVDPIQFYFSTGRGFSLRTYQLNLLAASTRRLPADLGCDFHTMDTRFISDLLVGLDRATACFSSTEMPGEVYAVTLDEEGPVASFGDFELSPKGSVESIEKWIVRDEDIDHFIWAIQQKFEYPLPAGISLDLPKDCRDEDAAVSEVVTMLGARRPAIMKVLDEYRR